MWERGKDTRIRTISSVVAAVMMYSSITASHNKGGGGGDGVGGGEWCGVRRVVGVYNVAQVTQVVVMVVERC